MPVFADDQVIRDDSDYMSRKTQQEYEMWGLEFR